MDLEPARLHRSASDLPPLTPGQRRRAVIAVTIGNGLEFYDFITFAFFAIQIGNTFFPSHSPYLSLMGSLATFGAGFITRPLGAHVLGGYADRSRRKPAMLISMLLMGGGILLLALTPGYATIGLAAPIVAVIARLMQGFALGGEVGSATSYMMESATERGRGLAMSWQSASQSIAQVLGSLIGLGLSLVMSRTQLDSHGWRIALLLGASIMPLALCMRRSLPETHHAAAVEAKGPVPLRSYRRIVALGLLLITSATITSYLFIYMATFGQNTLGLSSSVSFAGSLANGAIMFIVTLLGGWLSDHFGRKRVMIVPTVLFAVLIVPCFWWLNTVRTPFAFIAVNLVLAGTSKGPGGSIFAAIGEGLPQAVRARTFALVYSVPVAVFGGTTQMVLTWLLHVTGNPMVIAWYMTAIALLGLAAMAMLHESAPSRLGRGAPVPAM